MKYNYDANLECFVREDGLGKKFYITSTEAHRIITMYNLGNSVGEIRNKIKFKNPRKVTESTIKNFIINVNEGNIILSDDLPAPMELVEDLSLEDRVSKLEEIVSNWDTECICVEERGNGILKRVKGWIKY